MRCLFLKVFFHYSSRADRIGSALEGGMKNPKGKTTSPSLLQKERGSSFSCGITQYPWSECGKEKVGMRGF
jgi:hypothetical protein